MVLSANQTDNAGLRRCWWHCCKEENINPNKPTRPPLLFALDAKLGVAGGFHYAPDCKALRAAGSGDASGAAVYCGGDFSSGSFDGGTDGLGDGSGCGGGGGD